MADNYIERKMEELRQGKLGVRPASPRRGVIQVAFPPRRVVVLGSVGVWADAIVTAFRTAGCLVEMPEAAELAGLMKKWGGVDIMIGAGDELQSAMELAAGSASVISIGQVDYNGRAGGVRLNCVLPAAGADVRSVARVCVFLSEPGVASVNGALIPVE